jgi:thiol-disulfide isomerase/thioredoxin
MKYICILISFLCGIFDVCGQKATLTFHAPKEEMTVRIYKPIDGMPNRFYNPDELVITPQNSINYELEVDGFEFVFCRISNGKWLDILTFPGDHVEIICELQNITFSGSNAIGHKYYHDNYVGKGTGGFAERAFERYITKGSDINFDSIFNYFNQEKASVETSLKDMEMPNVITQTTPHQTDLKHMEFSSDVTPEFSAVLTKNLYFATCNNLLAVYGGLLRNVGLFRYGLILDKDIKPSDKDVQTMLSQLKQLYESPYAQSDDAAKMRYYSSTYTNLKYALMDDDAKKELIKRFDEDFFSSDACYLMDPDRMQLRAFGTLFMEYLTADVGTIENPEKLLAYMDEKFPNSEYVAIIKELMAQKSPQQVSDGVVILRNSISTLEELMQQPGIKGKYAYVDLWATWCSACLTEFEYGKDVRKELAQHKNIVLIYISLDKDKKRWNNGMAKHDLKGYNVWASELLQRDIGAKVYNARKVGRIPRYLLLSPEGNVINDNMPKPSASGKIKAILADALKQSRIQ